MFSHWPSNLGQVWYLWASNSATLNLNSILKLPRNFNDYFCLGPVPRDADPFGLRLAQAPVFGTLYMAFQCVAEFANDHFRSFFFKVKFLYS